MQNQQNSTSPQHRSSAHTSPRANNPRSDHPLPTQAQPMDRYDNQANDQAYDDYDATQAAVTSSGDYGATQAIIPSSEPDEDVDYMQDMRRADGFEGEGMGEGDEGMNYTQNQDYYQHQGQYQEEAEGSRGRTPISEHGEGAVAIYGQPGPGRRDQYEVNPYAAAQGQGLGRAGLQGYPSVRIADQVEEPDSQMPVDQVSHSFHSNSCRKRRYRGEGRKIPKSSSQERSRRKEGHTLRKES
jgi:hypothetical protein